MQVQYIQDRINERMESEFPGLQLQMEVQRINMTVVSGNDVTSEPTKFNLEQILGREMIQKTSPPDPDNKGEGKIEIDADIEPESLNISNQRFSLEVFCTPKKYFSLTSPHEAIIKATITRSGSIYKVSLSPIKPISAQITDI